MKKHIVIIALLFAAPLSLFAFDMGLTIDNDMSVSTDPNSVFFEQAKASLWMTFDISENIFFDISGFYRINVQDPYHGFALDQFEFSADFPVIGKNAFLFGLTLGRFAAEDFTGYVLAHPLDGARLSYRNAFMNITLSGGYTGLIFKGDSTLSMSIEDANYAPVIPLVPPRLVGLLSVDFPELFGYQTLYLSVIGQLDMRADADVITPGVPYVAPDSDNGGKIDTLYTGIGISGPVFQNFFWEFFFYFEFGQTLSAWDFGTTTYRYVPIYSYFSGINFDWFFPEFQQSKLTLEVLLASGDGDYDNYTEGDTDGTSFQFIPITRPSVGLVYSLQLTNVIIARLEFSLKPFAGAKKSVWDNLDMALSVITYFRAARSDVSDSAGLNSGSDEYYLGNEIDLVTTFRPLSDLGLELSLGLFLPNNYTAASAFATDGRAIEFLARLRLSIDM